MRAFIVLSFPLFSSTCLVFLRYVRWVGLIESFCQTSFPQVRVILFQWALCEDTVERLLDPLSLRRLSVGSFSRCPQIAPISHCIGGISMACRFHIYSLNCRYLQLKCTYLQFNCRYLQFNWRYLQFNWRYLQIG